MAIRMGALFKQLKMERATPSSGSSSESIGSSSSPDAPGRPLPPSHARGTHNEEAIQLRMVASLERHRIAGISTVYCIDEAISAAAEAALMDFFYCADVSSRWTQLRNRRLQLYGGTVTPRGLEDAEPLPSALQRLSNDLQKLGVFEEDKPPNHALINEYLPGQGIMAHTDGPAYWPRVCTISLGSPAIMLFQRRGTEEDAGDASGPHGRTGSAPAPGIAGSSSLVPVAEVLLRRGSAVVFQDDAYSKLLHSIPASHGETIGEFAPCLNADGEGGGEGGGEADGDGHAGGDADALGDADRPAGGAVSATAPCCRSRSRFLIGSTLERSTRVSITLRHVPLATPRGPISTAAAVAESMDAEKPA